MAIVIKGVLNLPTGEMTSLAVGTGMVNNKINSFSLSEISALTSINAYWVKLQELTPDLVNTYGIHGWIEQWNTGRFR